MKRVEWLVRATMVFCLLYVALASQTRADERFPFFGWDLFSRVPNPKTEDYTARIIAADGVETPVNFEDADLLSAAVEAQGYFALQLLGKHLESGDEMAAAVVRDRFEETYLSGLRNVRYEVVARTFDIRERIDCPTCFIDETVLGTYTVG